MRHPSFASLRRRAARSAARHGHRLHWAWIHLEWSQRLLWRGQCVRCGAEVDCDVDPPPNGIDIAGPAVAVECRREV